MKIKTKILLAAACTVAVMTGTSAKERILVNSGVTTHIVMPENIKLVDISTERIMGNQCTDNIVRIKPSAPNDSVQADTREPGSAVSIFHVPYSDTESYVNPGVSMPVSEMARYAWAVYGSKRKFHQVVSNAHGMRATVNNIYSVGDYFFIDYSLRNRTKIPYDIEEVRVKLEDKKETKATNSQTIELTPVFSLNSARKFRKDYRNVLVLPKLTFPEEKVLRLEISESQISGRTVTLTIEYEDILNADGFGADVLESSSAYPFHHYYINY